jgi:6-pyruvoyltetrahydropterin/6-carboxytetrahydropterin synthase
MYELTVKREFCAAHTIVIRGQQEPVHGHNWRVTVAIIGKALDEDGLLCDFHLVEQHVDDIIKPLTNIDLNATPPFDRINPTAEHIAKHIGDSLIPQLPSGVALSYVKVTEAPGCAAKYMPDRA